MKMANRRPDRFRNPHHYSEQFALFVDEELVGNQSELDQLTDDDDLDADPTFIPTSKRDNNEEEEEESSSGDEPDNNQGDPDAAGTNSVTIPPSANSSTTLSATPSGTVASTTIETPSTSGPNSSRPRLTTPINTPGPDIPSTPRERVFWKKVNNFDPLPPAPDYEPLLLNAMNFPPESYVSKYLPDNIFALLTEHTNRRHLEAKGTALGLTEEKMRKFFGATIMMSLLRYPRIRMYWEAATKVPFIASLVSRNLYFTIRKNLKVVTDTEVPDADKSTDKFWKVGPLLKSVRTGCLLNPKPKTAAVDEQMIPFWGHAPARQVIKTKPTPCGIKHFVVAAPDGLPLDFFFYQGKGDPIVNDLDLQNLNVGGKAVMKLLSTFPGGVSVYLDRFFTSELLLDTLFAKLEATGTGTLMKNKVPHQAKLKEDLVLKKEGRGSVDMSVRSDGQIAVIKWFDSKAVRLISNKHGVLPMDKCRRWCRVQKQYIEVDRPFVVKAYNTEMGGVDFLDRMISYYRISSRTKKWTVRVIMHFFDFSLAAAWIEYRRDQISLGTRKKDILDLFKFREQYAHFLAYGKVASDESSNSDSDYEPPASSLPPRKRARVAHPPDLLRKKNVMHMPDFPQPTSKNRCRMPGCDSRSARIQCSTCKVFLCLQDQRNCFSLYHNL